MYFNEEQNKNEVLVVNRLKKSFPMNDIIKNISLTVYKGESFVLLGGSGSGKSVLLKCMLGLMKSDFGEVSIAGHNLAKANQKLLSYVMKDIGVMFQSSSLFDSLTIWENISFRFINEGMDKKLAQAIAKEKLELVGLPKNCLFLYPSSLSGGMMKRAGLARAIAHNPKILFCDEPTTGLDPITSKMISQLIRDVVNKLGTTVFTITHDMECMRTIANKVAILKDGYIYWQGPVKTLLESHDPIIQQFIRAMPL